MCANDFGLYRVLLFITFCFSYVVVSDFVNCGKSQVTNLIALAKNLGKNAENHFDMSLRLDVRRKPDEWFCAYSGKCEDSSVRTPDVVGRGRMW